MESKYKNQIAALQNPYGLPEQDEIIILDNGLILIDTRNELYEELGEDQTEEILCG